MESVLLLLFEVKRVNGLESAKEERMKHIYGEVTRSELSAQSSSFEGRRVHKRVSHLALFLQGEMRATNCEMD